jgi:sporulation protein YlmC with PRC-barrel domain
MQARPYLQAMFGHCWELPLRLALLPPPSITPATPFPSSTGPQRNGSRNARRDRHRNPVGTSEAPTRHLCPFAEPGSSRDDVRFKRSVNIGIQEGRRMRLELGGSVRCEDDLLGELADVVIDPTTKRVTHLVVQSHNDIAPARLVPIELAGSRRTGDFAALHGGGGAPARAGTRVRVPTTR